MNSRNDLSKSEHNSCVLTCLGLFIGAVIGVFLGAFLLSFFQYQYYVYFKPEILKDGQFGMVFFNTIAIGGIAGGLFGGVLGGISGFFISRKVLS